MLTEVFQVLIPEMAQIQNDKQIENGKSFHFSLSALCFCGDLPF